MKYELFYLVGVSKEAELDKIKAEAAEIVTGVGGKFSEKETLEKRRLAYEVKRETHGIYVAKRFELEEGEKLNEIINKLNLHPGILRFVISRAEELPELKSKEERISDSQKSARSEERPVKEVVKSEKKEAPRAEVKAEEKKEEEKKADQQEDIDKKLEEILNI